MSFDEKPTRRLFTSYLSVELIERSYREDFVPAEKLVYLSVALNIAAARGMECVVFGVSQYSTHPDCTLEFVDAFSAAAGLALVGEKYAYGIHTPLIQRTKKQIVELAGKLEGCMETLAKTTTCLNGGIPCLHCAACLRRAQGFHDAGVADPLIVALKAAGMLGRRVPDDGFIEVVEVDEDDEFPETTGGSTIDER
jgi:7-cyano-7-deazaguanine synthase